MSRYCCLGVVPAGPAADLRRAAVGGQARPALDLDPPALVVGQVQVQRIDLVHHDLVDVALHLLRREEVPRHVEHGAAAREARVVHDPPRRHRPRTVHDRAALDPRRQQLAQRLHAGEQALRRAGPDLDPVPVDVEPVALGAERVGHPAQLQRDDRAVPPVAHRQRVAGGRAQHAGEVLGDLPGTAVGVDGGVRRQVEHAAVPVRCHRHRGRYHLGHARLLRGSGRRCGRGRCCRGRARPGRRSPARSGSGMQGISTRTLPGSGHPGIDHKWYRPQGHPLSAPAVAPDTSLRCTMRKNTSAGSA